MFLRGKKTIRTEIKINKMKKVNLLTRAEMRKVMGGTQPVGGSDCKKTCDCGDGKTMEAEVTNCDKDTCNTSGTGATCKVDGTTTGQSCATVCQYA